MTETNLIVGAGQAAGWAAMAMRDSGFNGHIIVVGSEPWQPYERPPLSKAMLTASEEPTVTYFHTGTRYAERNVTLRLGETVEAIEPAASRVILRSGKSIPYDRLLIATGGRARTLPIPGGEHAVLLRTLEDARALRHRLRHARHVVCIGAGVIGLEIASSARTLGCDVIVLEAAPRSLGRAMSPEAATFVEHLHARAGTTIHTGVRIEAIEPNGEAYVVLCAGMAPLHANLVIAGIGMKRNDELAAQAGIETDNGILVDERARTSVPNIFAAGDVAAFHHPFYGRRLRLEVWRHAQNQGIAAGKTMAGEETAYDDIPWFWTDQHGVNIQITGLVEKSTRTIVRVGEPTRFVAVHVDDSNCVTAVTAAGSPRDIRPGTALIRSRRPVDPLLLADPNVPLAQLARGYPRQASSARSSRVTTHDNTSPSADSTTMPASSPSVS